MIPKVKSTKLVEIFFFVSDLYDTELKYCCERFSNNNKPDFSDEEIITIYLFCVNVENRFKVRAIYNFADDYLRSWFPKLPSYQAFNNRLNRLSEAFRILSLRLLQSKMPSDCITQESLLDSMPIITSSGKRAGKVAPEIAEKGYCSTKLMYYYGVKLHALAFRRENQLPYPEQLIITPASENDLNVFKNQWSDITNRFFFGDKIYYNQDYFEQLSSENNAIMLTPVKGIKNQPENIKQFDKAANDLFSKAVSTIRQPIEGFFNWIIEKTGIQFASKVRSTKGLLVHVFGKIAAAFIHLVFNP